MRIRPLARAVLLASTVLLLNFANTSARADDGPQLSQRDLGRMLEGMKLQPKLDEERYDFAFEAVHRGQKWNLSMSAVLSANGESIWLVAWLDELPKSAADVPRAALLRLLADNDKLGRGKFFAYIPTNRRFVMQRVVPNSGMTPAKFRDALQDLGGSVAATYSHWSVAGWVTSDDGTAARPSTDREPINNATRESSKFRGTSRN